MKYVCLACLCWLIAGCATEPVSESRAPLDASQIASWRTAQLSSADALALFDNTQALNSKLERITNAVNAIDMAYPSLGQGYSSSVLSRTLIDAARRGVNVRLLVDYQQGLAELDHLSMLAHYGNTSRGQISIRLFNAPTTQALYEGLVSVHCLPTCNDSELAEWRAMAESGQVDQATQRVLAGIYGNEARLVVHARSEPLAPSQLFSWLGASQTQALHQNAITRLLGSSTADGVSLIDSTADHPALVSHKPYHASILNHSLLIVDDQFMQLGRSLSDSHHISQGALSAEQPASSLDIAIALPKASSELRQLYQRLWTSSITLPLNVVRARVPNDELTAIMQARTECQSDQDLPCLTKSFTRWINKPLSERIHDRYQQLQANALEYDEVSPKSLSIQPLAIDSQAVFHVLENLPFMNDDAALSRPVWRPVYGQHVAHHQMISAVSLGALQSVCAKGASGQAQQVHIQTGDAFLSANILAELALMVEGRVPCANVDINLYTNNSIKRPVSATLAQNTIKALLEHQATKGRSDYGASIRYYELASTEPHTLAQGVWLLGDQALVTTAALNIKSWVRQSNIGVLIEQAPTWLTSMNRRIEDQKRSGTFVDLTRPLQSINWATHARQQQGLVNAYLGEMGYDRLLLPKSFKLMQSKLAKAREQVYELSQKIVRNPNRAATAKKQLDTLYAQF